MCIRDRFNMSWTDSQVESLISFYSSVLVSGARNFATGVKNWRRFLERVSGVLGQLSELTMRRRYVDLPCLASGTIRPASYTDDLALRRRTRYVFIPSFSGHSLRNSSALLTKKNSIKGHNTIHSRLCYMP